jgi:hypothetical protein
MDMIRQSAPCPGSLEISLQNSSDKMQAYPEVFEDMEITCAAPGQEVELTDSKYQEIGQVYLDPIDVYMEKKFITEQPFISSIFVALQVYQAPYDDDQAHNHFQVPLTNLFLNWVKNIERAKVPDPTFDWLYWIFHID